MAQFEFANGPRTDDAATMLNVRCGSVSITGNFRDNNEDNYCFDPDGNYFLVADGMGGQSAGEKASELAVELIPEKLKQLVDFSDEEIGRAIEGLDESVAYANLEIMALGEIDPEYRNMGTTVAFVVRVGEKFLIGGVGDSRVYLLRNDNFAQLTTDHSLTQALLDAGTITEEEAANHRYKNVLYRYLGTKDGGSGTEAREVTPEAGDRMLICSDGVMDGLPDDAIAELLATVDEPQTAAERIVEAAEIGGSHDNITCVTLFVS